MKKLVNGNTVAIVGTVGTAELGVVDPIEQLAHVAKAQNVYLHVDAAFGGLVIPFLANPPMNFDFNLEEVQSVTVDPHKMGMVPIPAGGIIFRNPKALESIQTETPYLSDHLQYTFVGTRSGASVASAWAVFRYLGVEGYKKIITKCMQNTRFLAGGLTAAGFQLVVEPTLNIIAFRSQNTKALAEKLWRQGWFVSYVPRFNCMRVVLMPHVKKRHVEAFLKKLEMGFA